MCEHVLDQLRLRTHHRKQYSDFARCAFHLVNSLRSSAQTLGAAVPLLPRPPFDWLAGFGLITPSSPIWEEHGPRVFVLSLIAYCHEYLGHAKLLAHILVEHVCRTHNVEPPSFGVDDCRVGTIYSHPLPPSESGWLKDLLRRGVLVFGVKEHLSNDRVDLVPNRFPTSSMEAAQFKSEYTHAMGKIGQAQSVGHHVIRVELPIEHVAHPDLWHTSPPQGYPFQQGGKSFAVVIDELLNDAIRNHHDNLIVMLREGLGCGPFPSARGYVAPIYRHEFVAGFSPTKTLLHPACYIDEDSQETPSSSQLQNSTSLEQLLSSATLDPPPDAYNTSALSRDLAAISGADGGYATDLTSSSRRARPPPKSKFSKPKDVEQEQCALHLIEAAYDGDRDARHEIISALWSAHGKKKKNQNAFEITLSTHWRDPEHSSSQREYQKQKKVDARIEKTRLSGEKA